MPVTTVRFGARQNKGIIRGYTGLRLVGLLTAGALVLVGFIMSTAIITAPAFILAVLTLATVYVPLKDRKLIEWAPIGLHWTWRLLKRQDIYNVRPTKPRPAGSLAIPGDGAALRGYFDEPSGAVMIYDPHRHTLTATCLVRHSAFVLLGDDEQQTRVNGWGRALAQLSRTGQISAIQVLEATIPDSGTALIDWWDNEGSHNESWVSRTYDAHVRASAVSSAKHRSTVSISLDLKKSSRAIVQAGRGLPGSAAILRQHMDTLSAALRSSQLHVDGWLNAEQLAALIRTAFDPQGSARNNASAVGRQLATAGPTRIKEHWDYFQSDSSYVSVLWMSEWPRTEAYPNFLHHLILRSGVRKSFSLVAYPVPLAEARQDIKREKTDYVADATDKRKAGQIEKFSDVQEFDDIKRREEEINFGHADMRFAGFVAISADSKDDLTRAVREIEQAAIQGDCETRVLVGQQAQAFLAAALPLGRGL